MTAIALLAASDKRPKSAPAATDEAAHLGVASCAGNNCHGAVEPLKTARVTQNEYLVWRQKDKHSKAFQVLGEERGRRIAQNLGLPDAQTAEICLNCHADNVAADRRGRQFQLADGVGCEACHGGSGSWLGPHLSGTGHEANLAAGLYPTEQPVARAERCLSCHVGDDKRFVDHRIMGAGHPPLRFELATFSAIQPAHYRVDQDYIERKGRPNDMQIWAVGQALEVRRRMDAVLDERHAPKGLQPELALFDCQACHHSTRQLQWRAHSPAAMPGRMRLYDANLHMLQLVAARVDPAIAKELSSGLAALDRAITEDWSAVRRAAISVRQAVDALLPQLVARAFDRDDALALARAVVASGADHGPDYGTAQQATMALGSIAAAMDLLRFADVAQTTALNDALGLLNEAVADDQTYRPERFAQVLREFGSKLPP